MDRLSGIRIGWLGVIALAAAVGQPGKAQTYKVVGQYKLQGATARGVTVDSVGRRLYVAGDEGVTVMNVDTGAVIGSIAMKHADDVLLVPAKQEGAAPVQGFISGAGTVMSFGLADLKSGPVEHLPTGGATTMCFDEFDGTVEAVSAEGSVGSLDAQSGKILRADKMATGAGQIACGTLNHIYVADTEHDIVRVLNHATGRDDGDLPMEDGKRPTGVALDTRGRRLFVSCENKAIEVIDTDAGFTLEHLPGGAGPGRALFAWTPQGKGQWKAAAFVAQQDGTLTGVRMNAFVNYTIGGEYSFPAGLNDIAYDAKTHRLFLSATRDGNSMVLVAGY